MPLRTCIACRKRDEQSSFIRVRARETEGRSAYICHHSGCIARAVKRLPHALRTALTPARIHEIRNYVIQ
ncbi:MAG: YlxR family protein [Fimbriimonadaceae bacterium]|nr:YlxR family protein [Fimbriimonadaceae bacterium]